MRIRSIHIRNFRGFADETFNFDSHTCLLGPNGAGKSTVLAALNLFFRESSSATDVASLLAEDFHNSNTYSLFTHSTRRSCHIVHHDNPQLSPKASQRPASFRERALAIFAAARPSTRPSPRAISCENRGSLVRLLNCNSMNTGDSRALGSCPGANGFESSCQNKRTGETKLEWQPKELTDTELNALIKEQIKEMNS